ncbi:hypothetical protein GCM10011390_33400 [Aureimonas endophytica]|uniref:Uncharacterized protein n=1 Tax=Aureimonas endophytica TaxID=2027858 RepID=A0A916ZS49_9HYPH|nr:hypothetical protein [Aureimonas endophytica]GGE11585.1 hypothetical protein GCM10011390_33400 [Aureimonas endophytica]
MANRADRRASAKIARQAVKRARTPTESAILKAAAAFAAGDDGARTLGASLSRPDFDAAWRRLADDLHDILEDAYVDFRTEAYAEAGLGGLTLASAPGGAGEAWGTRLFLCPLAGAPAAVAAFAGDPAETGRLAASLHESGVVAERGTCLVLPRLLPFSGFAPDEVGPGRVRALHDALAEILAATLSGAAAPSGESVPAVLSALCDERSDAPGAIAFGALVGIELVPPPRASRDEATEEELEAEAMARAAALDSWSDSYADGLADLALGAPLDWPASASALAWEMIRLPLTAALLPRGAPEGRPDILHWTTTEDGRLVASAVWGEVAVGPFSAPADLVWLDADEFFGRAEACAERLLDHEDEAEVLAPLLGAA